MTRLEARIQKNLQGWEIDQINWNLTHKWAMNQQNAQVQKKLYNKVYAIRIFSCDIVWGYVSKQNVIYTNLSKRFFLQTSHKQPGILRVDDKYTYVWCKVKNYNCHKNKIRTTRKLKLCQNYLVLIKNCMASLLSFSNNKLSRMGKYNQHKRMFGKLSNSLN